MERIKSATWIKTYFKGITPNYVEDSSIIVLNQKCVRNFHIDYSLSRCVSEDQTIGVEKFLQVGDILINSTGQGTAGRCAVIESIPEGRRLTIDSHMLVLRCNDPTYIYPLAYSFFYNEELLMGMLEGSSGQSELDRVRVFDLELVIPQDENRRKKITEFLKEINARICNNSASNIELDNLARTVFNHWFLQFDFPNASGKPYLASGGKMKWDEKTLQDIPESWGSVSFKDIIIGVKNGDWGNDIASSGNDTAIVCFRGADFISITEDYRLSAPTRYINGDESKILTEGNLVVEISGGSPTQSTGRIGYVNSEFLSRASHPMCCSNFCKAFSVKIQNSQFWFYQMWKSLYDSGVMFNFEGKTTGIKNLAFDELIASVYVAQPDQKLLDTYESFAKMIYARIQNQLQESLELAELREFIIPLLLTEQVLL